MGQVKVNGDSPMPITGEMYQQKFGALPTPEELLLWAVFGDDYTPEDHR